ncbi:BAG family molecular chaperone regulator 4 isoform X1 [Mauremys mutica]|uniref:BAG family molecular chaperone regulator 4 isoform X1 n=1 Tax=Mauremys mutica TaxID=74926 RepID=UPI001D16C13A|nr:BAG family molecular chaperone regulator 4 isoform X1 [Mauremys mutica]
MATAPQPEEEVVVMEGEDSLKGFESSPLHLDRHVGGDSLIQGVAAACPHSKQDTGSQERDDLVKWLLLQLLEGERRRKEAEKRCEEAETKFQQFLLELEKRANKLALSSQVRPGEALPPHVTSPDHTESSCSFWIHIQRVYRWLQDQWPLCMSLCLPRQVQETHCSDGLESPYTNGAYGAPGAAPHYANLPQSNTYYSSGHPRASYPAESPSMYRPPSPASLWHYPPPDCPPEGPSLRRQAPGYSPPLTPGMPVPHYPYGGDTNPGIPQQGPPPQPRPQDESWASSGIYGMQPRYAWPAASTPQGSSFISESSPSWSGNGAPSPHPPAHDTKDATYDKPDQGANHNNYFPEVNQQPSGTMNDHKSTQFNTKPSHFNSKVQYSAQPQMYNNVPRKPPLNQDAGFKPSDQPLSNSLGIQPGIQRVMQVMEEVEQLEQEVDEFVGKKTDKAYRLLEEMLTKELLELDSIETHGQDDVRQARKEAVHRIQAILEKLEKKGL